MKKAILLCGMLLALTASVTYAAGVNMRWTNCFADLGPVNSNFACNTNGGLANVLVCSFEIDAPLANMIGDVMVVDLASQSPTLPAWWTFKDPASCRPSALSIALFLALAMSAMGRAKVLVDFSAAKLQFQQILGFVVSYRSQSG